MKSTLRVRRVVAAFIVLLAGAGILLLHPDLQQPITSPIQPATGQKSTLDALNELAVKGRAPKTGYTRAQFGGGWASIKGCDTRNIILHRDLKNVITNEKCQVTRGVLADPYTGKNILFERGAQTSDDVQIDHVVALSDAWQKGAQQLSLEQREQLANDPLELLAVDGEANQEKSDGDAATWLPPNKAFRCEYVARQVAVKKKYHLWVTAAEKEAIARVLIGCPK